MTIREPEFYLSRRCLARCVRVVEASREAIPAGLLCLLPATLFTPREASAQDTGAVEGAQTGPRLARETPPGTQGESNSHAATAPRIQAVRLTGSLNIDGRPDEEVWASAPPVSRYRQTQPFEGEPNSQRTEARFLYDDDALYVGAMLYSDGPVAARLKRRDASFADTDLFAVFIDGYHDHKSAYRFAVNAAGVRKDSRANADGSNGDMSWDPVWEAATRVSDEGWSVEMRIPFSQLRFSPADIQVWGLQIERKVRFNNETTYSAFTPLLERGGVARFGHIEGIEGIEPARPWEVLPYITGRADRLHAPAGTGAGLTDPFRSGSDYFGSAGLDLKYRVSTNLTLDAAVNPDFGQVSRPRCHQPYGLRDPIPGTAALLCRRRGPVHLPGRWNCGQHGPASSARLLETDRPSRTGHRPFGRRVRRDAEGHDDPRRRQTDGSDGQWLVARPARSAHAA